MTGGRLTAMHTDSAITFRFESAITCVEPVTAKRSPKMRAERARLKSCKDDDIFPFLLKQYLQKPQEIPIKQGVCACLLPL
jgi:hypothetical protein